MQICLSTSGSAQDECETSHFYPNNGSGMVSMKKPGLDLLYPNVENSDNFSRVKIFGQKTTVASDGFRWRQN